MTFIVVISVSCFIYSSCYIGVNSKSIVEVIFKASLKFFSSFNYKCSFSRLLSFFKISFVGNSLEFIIFWIDQFSFSFNFSIFPMTFNKIFYKIVEILNFIKETRLMWQTWSRSCKHFAAKLGTAGILLER
jgi:hypothetical protein